MESYYFEGTLFSLETYQTVRVKLQDEEYVGYVVVKIGGNTRGESILTTAIDIVTEANYKLNIKDFEENGKHILDADGYPEEYVLINPAGEELQIEYPDISDFIVAVEIIAVEGR